MSKGFKVLRVEDASVTAAGTGPVVTEATPPTPAKPVVTDDVDHWRRMAVHSAERLAIAENQAKDLRQAADDARARFGKYKDRLDKAQARVNEQQVEIVRLSLKAETLQAQIAERDAMLVKQDQLARKVHGYRQQLLDYVENGPIWELFMELAVCPPSAGEGSERK
jgi:hypothetical protein